MLGVSFRILRNGVAICLLGAAAFATWYWSRAAPERLDTTVRRPTPLGYYLRDAVLLGTNEQGSIVYRIEADLANERPEDGALLLSDVEIRYQPGQNIPWRVEAARAEVHRGTPLLQLEGGVRIERAGGEAGKHAVLETPSLRFEPEEHKAVASGPVSFQVGGRTLHAEGLTAFLKEDRLELESNIRGRLAE